jgi:dolichyl-phosphate-mannose-protein mannosyltransferase
MKLPPSLIEFLSLTVFFAVGLMLRASLLHLESVEHFDEGVYASSLWYDGQFGEPYPARYLFAPPLLSGMMEGFGWIPGLARFAPFLPCVLLGTATILSLWWLARSWFGKPAGIFIAAVAAMSDFHIIYSRMALTDVACLFWIVFSVGLGTHAVSRQSFRMAVASGFVCGLAWWTKYTGWLPLAILCSGSGLWWLWHGRHSIGVIKFTGILGTIAIVAALTFAPWWWQLQPVGGYQAVSQTHASYLTGWPSWSKHLAQQLHGQFLLDGFTGQISLGLGLFAAAVLRWTSGRSTWNAHAEKSPDVAANNSASLPRNTLPPITLLLRFTAAAIAMSIIAFQIWSPLMLICITFAGLTGIYLWPVLQRAWLRRQENDLSPTSPGGVPLSATDLECAPTIDPTLGFCTTLAWFVGMLLATPMYTPYSRLFFPLTASIWMASAGGIAWWLESNLSVARRATVPGEPLRKRTRGQHLVSTLLIGALMLSFVRFDENRELALITGEDIFRSSLFDDRRSIQLAAEEIADDCVVNVSDAANGNGAVNVAIHADIDLNSISPDVLRKATEATGSISETDGNDTKPGQQLTPEERGRTKLIVYVYGEPALLYHLNQTGIIAAPVSHLNLRDPGGKPPQVPTFVVFGPNAKRTHGFWEELMVRSSDLRPVTAVTYAPSLVTLLDMFDPKWLRDHPEAMLQTFEVHRVE